MSPRQETVTTPPLDGIVKGPLATSSSSGSVVDVVLGEVVEVVDVFESGAVVEVVEPVSIVVGVDACVVGVEDAVVVELVDVVEVAVVSRFVSVVDEVEEVGFEMLVSPVPSVLEVAEMGRSVT